METHRKSEWVEADKLQPSRFLSIRTDRKPRAKFLFCIPLNLADVRGVASLTTGLHTTDLLVTLALTVCLSVDFIERRCVDDDEETLKAVVCAMFFAPLATRVLVNLAAVTASYVLLMKEEKRRAKDMDTFVDGLLDRLKIWLIIIVIMQAGFVFQQLFITAIFKLPYVLYLKCTCSSHSSERTEIYQTSNDMAFLPSQHVPFI